MWRFAQPFSDLSLFPEDPRTMSTLSPDFPAFNIEGTLLVDLGFLFKVILLVMYDKKIEGGDLCRRVVENRFQELR